MVEVRVEKCDQENVTDIAVNSSEKQRRKEKFSNGKRIASVEENCWVHLNHRTKKFSKIST